MGSTAKIGTFDELLALADAGFHPVIERLCALVKEVHPETTEVIRLGDKAASYGWGPKKMKEGYVYVMPQKKHVNLGFYQGGLLDDPEGLLEGSGAKLRHIKVKSLEAAEAPAVRALIVAAVAERKGALGL